MAIFNNGNIENKGDKTDANTTIITAGTKIKGELELSCNLYIDGELEGVVNSSKEVNVGKNGKVKGDITAKRLVIQGFIEGSVHSDRVEIKPTGHVKGEITSVELVVEAKGLFEGNSVIKREGASKVSKTEIRK